MDKAKRLTKAFHELLADERIYLAATLRLLGEIDAQCLFADMGYASLFSYCTSELGLSEQQAYLRINVARTARRHPEIFNRIESGELHMSGVHRLSPALRVADDPKNLIEEASHLSKRDIQALVAEHGAVPDEPVQRAPTTTAPGKHLVRVTIGDRCRALIEQVQALGGSRDLSELLEEALETHAELLLRRKLRTTSVPGRRVTQAVKVEVWERDQGQCSFQTPDGQRCTERRDLQFDHVNPVALGGVAESAGDIRLLCPAHNQLMADRLLDPQIVSLYRDGFRPRRRSQG